MKLRRLFWLVLAGSLLFSAKQLRDLHRLYGTMKSDPAAVPERLQRMAASNPAMEKLVSEQMKALDVALEVGGGGGAASEASPGPSTAEPRRPVDTRLWDTNSMSLPEEERPAPGGGILIDSSGRRYEVAPSPKALGDRTRSLALRPSLPRLRLPDIGGPGDSLKARRDRALILLGLSVVSAVLLVVWARRFRP